MAPDPSVEPGRGEPYADDAAPSSRQSEVDQRVRARLSPELRERMRREAETVMLGGAPEYTRDDVSALTGIALEHTASLWTAMGFAANPVLGSRKYTAADVEALRSLGTLRENTTLTPAVESAMVRTTAQAMSRLAEWQVAMMTHYVGEELLRSHPGDEPFSEEDAIDAVHRVTDFMLPLLQGLQTHVWRRHLAAAVERTAGRGSDSDETQLLAIGFADMVGYTHLIRGIDVGGLNELLEDFESTATRVVAENRGWIIKNLGDEVMFAATDPRDAAAIGLALQDAIESLEDVPMIRVGIAYGPVLLRFGDAFGSVVNIAARLTSSAKPGTVLIGDALNRELATDDTIETRPLRPIKVRGFSKLRPHLLRRGSAPTTSDE